MGFVEMVLVYGSFAISAFWYLGAVGAVVWLVRHLNKRLRLKEQELELSKQRASQTDEALKLLKSIKENMAYRTTKN